MNSRDLIPSLFGDMYLGFRFVFNVTLSLMRGREWGIHQVMGDMDYFPTIWITKYMVFMDVYNKTPLISSGGIYSLAVF